jgi:hypothetical protein
VQPTDHHRFCPRLFSYPPINIHLPDMQIISQVANYQPIEAHGWNSNNVKKCQVTRRILEILGKKIVTPKQGDIVIGGRVPPSLRGLQAEAIHACDWERWTASQGLAVTPESTSSLVMIKLACEKQPQIVLFFSKKRQMEHLFGAKIAAMKFFKTLRRIYALKLTKTAKK